MFEHTYNHHSWSKELPAKVEEYVGSSSGHLFNAIAKPRCSEKPTDGDSLEKHHPQQGHARA